MTHIGFCHIQCVVIVLHSTSWSDNPQPLLSSFNPYLSDPLTLPSLIHNSHDVVSLLFFLSHDIIFQHAMFLWLQISTFDKVLIPMITHFLGNQDSPLSFCLFSLLHTLQDRARQCGLVKTTSSTRENNKKLLGPP